MLNIDFVLLIILCLLQWRLVQAQSGICEASGFCQESEHSCQRDGINSCFLGSGAVYNKRVTYDDEGTGEEIQTSCIESRCTVQDTTSNIFLKNMTLNYISINPSYFKLRVSWFLTKSSGYRGGYELRITNIFDRTSSCYCIGNSNRTRVTIHNMRYDILKKLKSIDVLPYPYPHFNEKEIMVSQRLHQNIEGCADIEHNGTLCGSKPYPKPEKLSVESSWCGNDTKTLKIMWDPPNVGSHVPLPKIYHVSLYSDPIHYIYTQFFAVKNVSQVVLFNLSVSQMYKVYVTPYHMCSGLGDASEILGCGASAGEIEKRIGNCDSSTPDHITTLYRSEGRDSSTPNRITSLYRSGGSFVEQLNATDDINLVPVLISVILILNVVLVIAVSLVVFLCTKLYKHQKGENHSCNHPTMIGDDIYKVFVFYLSQTDKVYIQKYVICNLLKYFKVKTPDDINRGNISIWLEDAVNSADSVLLVGNEEFCSEWGKKERAPVLNSLELLISAAVSQNTIAKFGFILIGERRMVVPIPENSYLKLMPVFFMGDKKCEVEKVYHFVTRSRVIELAQESNYDNISS